MGEDMLQYLIHRTASVFVVVVVLGLALSCCDDENPVKPPPVDRDYPVYFTASGMNGENALCYQYHPATGEVDSFPLPVWPRFGFAVSADGSQIWISRYDTAYVFDVESKTVLASLPFISGGSRAIFSPDNQLVALSGNGIYFINAHDFSIVFHDSAAGGNIVGQFTTDGRRYYCAIAGGYGYRVDLDSSNGDTLRHFENIGSVQHILPSLDENRLFIVTRLGIYTSGFFVYDILLDSIIYSDAFAPQPARIKTSPCGNYVYLTAGGTLNSVDIPPFSFAIFDVQANRFIEEVKIMFSSSAWPYFPMDYCIVTPDGRYLVGSSFFDEEYLPVYDLIQHDTVSILRFGDKLFGYIECQTGL